MPTTNENKTYVQRATDIQAMKNAATDTAYTGAQIEGQSVTLSDEIMKAVRSDRQARGVSNIASEVGATMGQLVSDPEAIRSRTSATGLVAPTTVNALTSDARALNLATLGEQATQQKLNQGSLDDIITAGANQLKAKAQQMKAQALQEEAKADALMEALQFEQSEKKREFDEWLEREKLNKSDSGGVSMNLSDLSLEGTPTSESPQMTPAKDGIVSEDGQWISKGGTWVSNVKGGSNLSMDDLQTLLTQAVLSGNKKNVDYINSIITAKKKLEPSATEQAKVQADADLQNILGTIEELKTQPEGITNTITWKSKLNIATQRLAKWIEKSRLSDADRKFYLDQMPNTVEIMTLPGVAAAKIDGVVSGITGGGGYSSGKYIIVEE